MKALWLIALLTVPAVADDFQLLRADPTGYQSAEPGYRMTFPADHLPHPDFRIEWWYLTANLTDADGQLWGVQWTLFRQALTPDTDPGGWASNQMWMAHAALSTPKGHRHAERFARGGIGQAGVGFDQDGHLNAWLDDWQWMGSEDEFFPAALHLNFQGVEVDLQLTANTPWVLQGDQGYHQKSDLGRASYYYSQPHIQIDGELTIEGETLSVTGPGWLDREWSSQPLAPNQPGWDWFSLHLDDGSALMIYQLRQNDGPANVSGTWIDADGRSTTLPADAIELSVNQYQRLSLRDGSEKNLPLDWTLTLPERNLRWRIQAERANSWLDGLFPYWEGPVRAEALNDRTPPGLGYLELTGY